MKMRWFLLVFIIPLVGFGIRVDGIQPAAEVVGSVFCDTCLRHRFSKSSHFVSGASVSIKCQDGISTAARTDGNGQFRARLPFSALSENKNGTNNCTVRLVSSSDRDCSIPSISSSSSLRLKSRRDGVYMFAVKFLTFRPRNPPIFCRKLEPKKSIIPLPGTSTNPTHKKLIESSSDKRGTTGSFPEESVFPPFPLPFQPPPFFPPIPGFTPPPLIPLPPIPGFTPPPPLIPLPPIPGFTPPSPPPFIPIPPIPFPGFTPPPPPPLFPLPPIPGFTPPTPPPPAPFFPIPFPPKIPFPGFTPPPPPPPPPPPAFPFPPLPPFPGRPPASPSAASEKGKTSP